jgi:hypothetical protein
MRQQKPTATALQIMGFLSTRRLQSSANNILKWFPDPIRLVTSRLTPSSSTSFLLIVRPAMVP